MCRVRQAGEWQVMLGKIAGEGGGILRTDDQDGRFTLLELSKVLAQLRHMRTAEWSHEAAIEDQQDIPAAQIREPDGFSTVISQLKIWGGGIDGHFGHGFPA